MKIRKAARREIPRLVELWWDFQTTHPPYDPVFYRNKSKAECLRLCQKYYQVILASKNHIFLVAETNGKLVGFIMGEIGHRPPVYRTVEAGFLSMIYIIPEMQRKGAGTRLVQALEKEFRRRKIRHVELVVDKKNRPALELYRKCGYQDRQVKVYKRL